MENILNEKGMLLNLSAKLDKLSFLVVRKNAKKQATNINSLDVLAKTASTILNCIELSININKSVAL